MGTFHLLDGRKLKVFYRGNQSTCGWCHQNATKCKGDGRAKTCKESGSQQIHLTDHMQRLWSEIGFSPGDFKAPEVDYDDSEDGDNLGGDRKVLKTSHFPRKLAHPTIVEDDKNKFTIARIKNFPVDASDDIIVNFLQKEVDERIVAENFKSEKTGHSTNIYLGPEPSLEVVAKAIETLDFNTTQKTFFEDRKIYAQLYRPLTPEKPAQIDTKENEDDKPNSSADDSKVKSVVNSFNNSLKDQKNPGPKNSQQIKKISNSHTNLSSAGTPTVARHKEDMRVKPSTIKK